MDQSTAPVSAPAPLTVLVAENDRALREFLRINLQNAGYGVILAPDAMVAGRTILQNSQGVDALIVDAQLPFMSGIDFVSTIIADTSLKFIPTILLCASDEEARRGEMLGVPCLTTPLSTQQLLDQLAAVLRNSDAALHPVGNSLPSMRERLDRLAAQSAKPSLRVVIADDEPDTVATLTAILSHEGHSVFATHHSLDVLPEVRLNKPDAVILDIDMPKVSGFAIAREIRDMFGETAPMLIAVSGKWFGQTDKMLAQVSGFDHFMQKPCHPDALLSLLSGLGDTEKTEDPRLCEASLAFQV